MITRRYIINDKVYRVEIEEIPENDKKNIKVFDDEEEGKELFFWEGVKVIAVGSEIIILKKGECIKGAFSFDGSGNIEVSLNGLRYEAKDAEALEDEEEEEGEGGPNVTAPMPGKVVKLLTDSGKKVEKGEALIIVESMKMETKISANVSGTVKAVKVKPGQNVNQGDILIEIEPEQ